MSSNSRTVQRIYSTSLTEHTNACCFSLDIVWMSRRSDVDDGFQSNLLILTTLQRATQCTIEQVLSGTLVEQKHWLERIKDGRNFHDWLVQQLQEQRLDNNSVRISIYELCKGIFNNGYVANSFETQHVYIFTMSLQLYITPAMPNLIYADPTSPIPRSICHKLHSAVAHLSLSQVLIHSLPT